MPLFMTFTPQKQQKDYYLMDVIKTLTKETRVEDA